MNDKILKDIEKKYNIKAVSMTGEEDVNIKWLPTEILALDLAIGKGLPLGRIIELFGKESSGKSTIALKAIASAQKQGMKCCYIDMEHAFDPIWAGRMGVNCEELVIYQPEHGEQAFDIMATLIQSGEYRIAILDSIAACVPKAEIEGSMEDQQMGLQARMMGKAMRKLGPLASEHDCAIILINQIRQKIGVMYGNPNTTPGGEAVKFYASVRINVSRISKSEIKVGDDDIIAHKIKIAIPKNKVGTPYKEKEFMLYYDTGADNYESFLDYCCAKGLIVQKGSAYQMIVNGETISYVGMKRLKKGLKKSPEIIESLITASAVDKYYIDSIKNSDVDTEESEDSEEGE